LAALFYTSIWILLWRQQAKCAAADNDQVPFPFGMPLIRWLHIIIRYHSLLECL